MTSQSILIITIPPIAGGVPDKARILVNHFRDLGHEVTVAHYATLSDYADLVVPSWQIFFRETSGFAKRNLLRQLPLRLGWLPVPRVRIHLLPVLFAMAGVDR